jgi:hypothetical protein
MWFVKGILQVIVLQISDAKAKVAAKSTAGTFDWKVVRVQSKPEICKHLVRGVD